MANVKIKFNRDAFRKMRTTPEAEAYLDRLARRTAESAGEGYAVGDASGSRTRARSTVYTQTAAAMRDNATRNTLIRSLPFGG